MTARSEQSPESTGFDASGIPPEIATLLIFIGILGIPLPGPGVPFILAGGLALWPRTFQPFDDRFRKKFPAAHESVFALIGRFEKDLNNRYPSTASRGPTSNVNHG